MIFLSTIVIVLTMVSTVSSELLLMSSAEIDSSRVMRSITGVTITACYLECAKDKSCDNFGVRENFDGHLHICHLLKRTNNSIEEKGKKSNLKGTELVTTPSQVCYGAKNDDFAEFIVWKTGQLKGIRLIHVSGLTYCTSDKGGRWGCSHYGHRGFLVVATDEENKIIFPDSDSESESLKVKSYYEIKDATINDEEITLSKTCPINVYEGQKLRIWNYQDLKGFSESNNFGKHCAFVQLIYDD